MKKERTEEGVLQQRRNFDTYNIKLDYWKCNFPIRLSVVLLICLFVKIFKKGKKLHFDAPVEALIKISECA